MRSRVGKKKSYAVTFNLLNDDPFQDGDGLIETRPPGEQYGSYRTRYRARKAYDEYLDEEIAEAKRIIRFCNAQKKKYR